MERQHEAAFARIDTTKVHAARRYDAWLGGKDNFAVDRESARRMAEAFPSIEIAVRENRRFLVDAVEYVARQGVRRFLDVGTGIPTSPNTREVAQSIAPDAGVVYVDSDHSKSGCAWVVHTRTITAR